MIFIGALAAVAVMLVAQEVLAYWDASTPDIPVSPDEERK